MNKDKENLHLIYLGDNKKQYLKAHYEDFLSFDKSLFDIIIWGEDEILKLLNKHYDKDLLFAYNSYIPYAYKSDIARLAILNIFGGWYSDWGIKKIADFPKNEGVDFFICRDHHTQNKWSVPNAFQNSLIFAAPDNDYIKYTLKAIVEKAKNRDYGLCYHDVTGPIFLAKVYDDVSPVMSTTFKIGDVGPKELDGRLVYSVDNVDIAVYKDQNINNELKKISEFKTDYSIAWKTRMVYEDSHKLDTIG